MRANLGQNVDGKDTVEDPQKADGQEEDAHGIVSESSVVQDQMSQSVDDSTGHLLSETVKTTSFRFCKR